LTGKEGERKRKGWKGRERVGRKKEKGRERTGKKERG